MELTHRVINLVVTGLNAFVSSRTQIWPTFPQKISTRFCHHSTQLHGKRAQTTASVQSKRFVMVYSESLLMIRDLIFTDKEKFPRSNKVFKAVLVKLKKEGKENVKYKAFILISDMQKIQASSELDSSTPAGLQNKVFVFLSWRTREHQINEALRFHCSYWWKWTSINVKERLL